ncbi:hypothetical protein HPB47_020834 [Ixodes persulcatus]|uniref:Uncharacterized protein n=1 Tax=Ixodes persulcatus TaxID=34615 RepID=A0AC60QF44_IXOPE|nr:hypothetical protein HPB47_020834 [Ixodes persulcatus]
MEMYSNREFLARFRLAKTTVREVLCTLSLHPGWDDRGKPLTPLLQLLVALRFYGAGAFQTVTGDLVNVSQPTVCRVVGRVTDLIARELFPKLVKFPGEAGSAGCNVAMHDFYKIGKFAGVTGCIDCTHVRIKSPGGVDAEVSRNRKGYFSINVQNKAHIKSRNSIENAFGVWKSRFPCLDMRLQHKPTRSAAIITACAALHKPGAENVGPLSASCALPPLPKPRRKRPLPPLPRLPADTGTSVKNAIIASHFT